MVHARYIDLHFPDRFAIETRDGDGGWMIWGVFEAKYTERLEDGSYVCHSDGHPLRLRCVRKDGDLIDVLDGGGFSSTYRLRDCDADD